MGCGLLFSISTVSEFSLMHSLALLDISVTFDIMSQIRPGCHRSQWRPLPVWGPSFAS